jgi:DNA-binding beta-propeller fold protein YncE
MRTLHVRSTLPALAAVFAVALSACGGSTNIAPNAPVHAGTAMPTNPSAPQSHATTAQVVIHIPPKSAQTAAHTRRPTYVSPSTASINVAVDGGTPVNTSLSSSSPNCTTSGNPPVSTCTITIDVPTGGMHAFAFTALDANSAPLSTNTVSQALTAGAVNALNVTLNGIPTSISVMPATANPNLTVTVQNGVQFLAESTQMLLINTLDADSNVIVGPGTPIITATVTNPSAGSGITLSPVQNSTNAFNLSSTGFGSATLTLVSPTPAGPTISTTFAVHGVAQVSTLAGNPDLGGFADGTAGAAQFNRPAFLAYNAANGNLYVTDSENCNVRQANPTSGAVKTIAGNATAGQTCGFMDGTGTSALFKGPQGIAYDANDGDLYVTDMDNCNIRRVNPTSGAVTTIAGKACANNVGGFMDGTGTSALFNGPAGIAYDASDGNLYVTDTFNCNIRQVNPTSGAVKTIAGNATAIQTCGFGDGTGTSALFRDPEGIAYDANDGNLYVTDTNNCNIRQVNPTTGAVKTIAGNATATQTCGFMDGTGTSTLFSFPAGIAYDASSGNLYVTDTQGEVIRQVNPAIGTVVTIAGSAHDAAFANGLGTNALFHFPEGIAIDTGNGNLYVTDSDNNLIRQIQP